MKTIKLRTTQGKFVANVEIPPFQNDPAVIIWGVRFFIRVDHNAYYEAFCYVVPTVQEAPAVQGGGA